MVHVESTIPIFKLNIRLWNICGYSDAYVLFKIIITVANTAIIQEAPHDINKKVIFKDCANIIDDGNIVDFVATITSNSFKINEKNNRLGRCCC